LTGISGLTGEKTPLGKLDVIFMANRLIDTPFKQIPGRIRIRAKRSAKANHVSFAADNRLFHKRARPESTGDH